MDTYDVRVTLDGPYLEFLRGKAVLAFYLDYGAAGMPSDRYAVELGPEDDRWEDMPLDELKAWLSGDAARRAAPAPG